MGVGWTWLKLKSECWPGSAWIAGFLIKEVLRREVDAWQDQRNRDMVRVDWRFTTADARIKLKSLYPAIHNS